MLRVTCDAWRCTTIELAVPDGWRLVSLPLRDAPALTPSALDAALDDPIGAPRLEQIARGQQSAAIAVDDITRPTRTAPIVSRIVSRLRDAGLELGDITVVIATGAHRRATADDIAIKVGGLGVRVVSHDPIDGVVDTGVMLAGVPVRVNREFMTADLRIGIGGVMPHPFAGFSGGGKIVLPGLSDLDAVVRSHKYALMGFAGGPTLDGNRFRQDMERAVRELGLHWAVNVVLNSRCETAAMAAGDFVQAHRAAVERATGIGATTPPDEPLDALVLNAFPKDSELLQIEAALVAIRAGMNAWLKPDAPVVLLASCREGLGEHQLFGPEGRLFRTPTAKKYLGGRLLHIVSAATANDTARAAFWDGYRYHATWRSCIEALAGTLPAAPIVGYAPCGPLHVPVGTITTGAQIPPARVARRVSEALR